MVIENQMYDLKTIIAVINKLNIFEKGKLFMFRFSQQYHFFSSTTRGTLNYEVNL